MLFFFLVACGPGKVTLGGDTGTADTSVDTDTAADTDTDTAVDTAEDTDTAEETGDSGPSEAPLCTISSPADGFAQAYDSPFTFAATASDPQDGTLPGSAISWTSSADATALGSGNNLTVTLRASGAQTITCSATDADGNVGTGDIVVTAISPVVDIWHPGDGETRAVGSDIPWVGNGRDLEDGALTGRSLVWTSNIDGEFGRGESFSAPLSAGDQVVTLTGTDADGNSSSAAVAFTVE